MSRSPAWRSAAPGPEPCFESVDTLCAQLARGRLDGEPLVPPLVQSTTFAREGLSSAAEHQYSRVSNPTVSALEHALGRLEDAPPGVAFASGLAAETALFLAVLRAGDHVVASRAQYGGTTRLLREILGGLGIETTLVDTTDVAATSAALRPETRLVLVETPSNPTLDVTDVRAISALARGAGALCAVDNTFLTGVLQRPLDLGADATVTSTTKLVEGHSVALGGAVVARDPALLERLRFVRKCTGSIQSPLNAWLTLQGMKTLPLRIRRQSDSARRVAEWLATAPGVERVHYPTLYSGEPRRVAERQHLGQHGCVLSFELDGGEPAAGQLAQRLHLARLVEHVGSVETLLTHSASMTHASVPPDERRRAGVTDGLLRLSVGLEDPCELIADLSQALASLFVRGEQPSCGASA